MLNLCCDSTVSLQKEIRDMELRLGVAQAQWLTVMHMEKLVRALMQHLVGFQHTVLTTEGTLSF